MSATTTKEAFLRRYLERTRENYPAMTMEELLEHHHAVPCDCNYDLCEGWALVTENWETHNGFPSWGKSL